MQIVKDLEHPEPWNLANQEVYMTPIGVPSMVQIQAVVVWENLRQADELAVSRDKEDFW